MRTLPASGALMLSIACGATALAFAATPQAPANRPGVQTPQPPRTPGGPVRDTGGRGPALAPGTSVLSGTVTTASGQPAAGTRVMISGLDNPPRTTMTDSQGRFSFSNLRASRYYLTATKPGHVTITYGQRRPNGAGTAIPLREGEKRDVAVQLPRGAVITGMILDERGEPAINVSVRGTRTMMIGGQRRNQQMAMDQTDDRGIYRLHSLQPGDYTVCATARNLGPQNDAQRIQMEIDSLRRSMDGATAAMRQQRETRLTELQSQLKEQAEPAAGYAPVCFPGSSPTGATAVQVAAGEERVGVDVQLQLTTVARLEGIVVAPGGVPPRNVQLMLMNADETLSDVERQGARVEDSGRFFFQNIAPGRYLLTARTMQMGPMGPPPGTGPGTPSAAEPRLWGAAEVTVAGQDLTDIVIPMQQGVTVSGGVIFQATTLRPPSDLSRVNVSMFPYAPDPTNLMTGNAQATVDASGRFTITDIVPGKYRFGGSVNTGGPGWMIDSVMVGGQDALDTPLEVLANRPVSGVVITFTDRMTELSGTVVTEKGEPATEHTLLLYPTDPKYWTPQSRRIRTMRAGADGVYVFRAIPPGDYRLTTLLDPEPGAWYEREVLEQLDASSVRVTLADGEKKVEHVRIRTGR